MSDLLSRITMHPDICHGKPVVRNLRYPVETLLELLSSGMTIEDILADYPDLEREDLLAVVHPHLEDRGDVGVRELDRDLRLVDEALDELAVGGEVGQDLLDDAELLEAGELPALGEEDLAHAAAAQTTQEEIASEHFRNRLVPSGRYAGGGGLRRRPSHGVPSMIPRGVGFPKGCP